MTARTRYEYAVVSVDGYGTSVTLPGEATRDRHAGDFFAVLNELGADGWLVVASGRFVVLMREVPASPASEAANREGRGTIE